MRGSYGYQIDSTGSYGFYGLLKFDPSQIFKNGEQGVWYDPSDLSTLFQDAAGTTPVTANGDPVGLMLDKSGNANHATQSVAASRPIYSGLQYDGVDDFLNLGSGWFPTGDFIFSSVLDTTGLSGPDAAWFGVGTSPDNGYLMYANSLYGSARNQTRLYFGSEILIGPDIRDTGTIVATVSRSGGNMYLHINGSLVASGSVPGTISSDVTYLGNWASSPRRYNGGGIGATIVVGKYSEEARTSVEKYLASKSGVTL